ncbi:hypothetical protein ACW7EJ_21445 [Acinetobacter soli]
MNMKSPPLIKRGGHDTAKSDTLISQTLPPVGISTMILVEAPTTLEALGLSTDEIPFLVAAVMRETTLQQLPEPIDYDYLKIIRENVQKTSYR